MKRIIFIVVIIIFVFIINNLVHSIYSLWQKQDLVTSVQRDLEREKKENMRLKKQISEVKSKEFIEQQARDKLLYVRPGEEVVVIPHELIAGTSSAQPTPTPAIPSWQQWWELFFQK